MEQGVAYGRAKQDKDRWDTLYGKSVQSAVYLSTGQGN